jgi:hypothetical protein
MDLSFQEQKTECFYLIRIKIYGKGCTKKLLHFKKCARTVKHTVRKKISSFLSISGTGRDISKKYLQIWIQQAKGIIQKKIT